MATSKKATSKKGRSGKRGGESSEPEANGGFTAGEVNPNIVEGDEVAADIIKKRGGETGELFEDRKIPALHRAAMDYAAVRDERMALSVREGDLKEKLRGLMHKHEKKTYTCDGIEIVITEETVEEKIKVRVPKADEGD